MMKSGTVSRGHRKAGWWLTSVHYGRVTSSYHSKLEIAPLSGGWAYLLGGYSFLFVVLLPRSTVVLCSVIPEIQRESMRAEGDAAVTQASGTCPCWVASPGENLAKPRLNFVNEIRNFTTKAPYFTLLSEAFRRFPVC